MRSSDPRIELLGGLSSEDLAHSLKQRLDTSSVIIRAGTTTAALAISTANVLARLVPNVSVVSASDQGVFVPPFGEGEIARIGAQVVTQARTSIPVEQSGPVVVVAVEPNRDADLYVSASAWSIRISDHPHEPLHGLGPATSAASALVAAEILRRLLPELPGVRLKDQLIEWNLLDYRLRIAPSEPPPGPVTSVCFGGGSVGSSVLYSLMLSGGAGTLTFVDPDHLSSRNKIRYPLLFSSSRALKVDWLSSLSTAQLHVAGAALSASDYISASTLPIESTIAAVDTASARRDVTDALAHETLEAGVAGL
ncbi:MAG TPA: hypothetical protein VGR71_08760, partial [Nitrospira sp.]|nr:hypothetical protein [Nitrospira sp.]